VTPETQADYEKMLRPLIEFARQQLRAEGNPGFLAATLSADGELVLVDAPFEGGLEDRIDYLRKTFAAEAETGAINACAVAYGIWISEPEQSTAVVVELEHRDDEPVDACVPYRKNRLLGWQFKPLLKTHGENRVFRVSAPP
jgi:hypothetical protein